MANFSYEIVDEKELENGSIEYLVYSLVTDKSYGVLYRKDVTVIEREGMVIIPNQINQLEDIDRRIELTFITSLKTFVRHYTLTKNNIN